MGTKGTAGFKSYRRNYGLVRVLPGTGYGVHGYGCGVGKPDPQVTRSKPYRLQYSLRYRILKPYPYLWNL